MVNEPPSKNRLKFALIKFLPEKKKIFNTRGKSYNLIDYDIHELLNEKIVELLAYDWKLIKRPFLVMEESRFIVGFNETNYANNFK